MNGILDTLKKIDDAHHDAVERWFASRRRSFVPYIYTSVDLRHSGLRLAPVDTNLFPAGFNNLSPAGRARASRFVTSYLKERHPGARRVLIVPENHTRNLAYLDNLAVLLDVFSEAGVEVKLGSLAAKDAPIELTSGDGRVLTQYPLIRNGARVGVRDFDPDLIVMNNDMTLGAPDVLQGAAQPVEPPLHMGWWKRRKSVHFTSYRILAQEFCELAGLDPWLITAGFESCGRVDFKERKGLDSLARGIDNVLRRAREKHRQYGIAEDPYVFVKADSGTYGMGIMTVRSADEMLDLNKKERNKMQVVKEGARVGEVIVQEGIPTVDTVEGQTAEPVIYMIDALPVGGLWRVNRERDRFDKLNAAGMTFTGMCDESEEESGRWQSVQECHFRPLGIVAAIAALAAAREYPEEGAGI